MCRSEFVAVLWQNEYVERESKNFTTQRLYEKSFQTETVFHYSFTRLLYVRAYAKSQNSIQFSLSLILTNLCCIKHDYTVCLNILLQKRKTVVMLL